MIPFLLITLHFSQIGFTDDLTFTVFSPFWNHIDNGLGCFSSCLILFKSLIKKKETSQKSVFYCIIIIQISSSIFSHFFSKKLLISPDDSSLRQIIRGQFYCYLIARKDTDIVHTQLSADMSQHLMAIIQFHLKHSVRELLQYFAFHLKLFCLRQSFSILSFSIFFSIKNPEANSAQRFYFHSFLSHPGSVRISGSPSVIRTVFS